MLSPILFSKNRAMQLDAFLRTWEDLTPGGRLDVLYTATSDRHARAYREVFTLHPCAIPHAQACFKTDLVGLLEVRCKRDAMFLVDDQLFIRPWSGESFSGLSLRLGPHLRHCYPTDQPQAVPPLVDQHGLLSWRWAEGASDWGYPLSVDGHIFNREELLSWVRALVFHTPNTLEAELQRFKPLFEERFGYCYSRTHVVNVPWNRVQDDAPNRHADTASAEMLLACWEAGQRLAVRRFYDLLNVSCHQTLPLVLEDRP